MKKLLFLALCFFAIKAQSQVIDTTITFCTAAKITPISYTTGIPIVTEKITHLGVFNYTDDLKGNCTANWTLIATNKNVITNSYTLTQEDYNEWDGYASGLLAVIGKYLKVTFK